MDQPIDSIHIVKDNRSPTDFVQSTLYSNENVSQRNKLKQNNTQDSATTFRIKNESSLIKKRKSSEDQHDIFAYQNLMSISNKHARLPGNIQTAKVTPNASPTFKSKQKLQRKTPTPTKQTNQEKNH